MAELILWSLTLTYTELNTYGWANPVVIKSHLYSTELIT